MAKHAEKWLVDTSRDAMRATRVRVVDAAGNRVATVDAASANTQEAKDIAHLIAAAPDLLAACELALANLHRNLASEESCGQPHMGDDEHEAIAVLTAAITKAQNWGG